MFKKKKRKIVNGRIKSNAGYRADCNIYFKSSMEANFYRYIQYMMKSKGHIVSIYYEPYLYMFPKNKWGVKGYRPDFYITDKFGHSWFVETKGHMTNEDKAKIYLFRKHFPDKLLIVYDGSSMEKIAKNYKKYIPNWE
jgi:hypothetical protein